MEYRNSRPAILRIVLLSGLSDFTPVHGALFWELAAGWMMPLLPPVENQTKVIMAPLVYAL